MKFTPEQARQINLQARATCAAVAVDMERWAREKRQRDFVTKTIEFARVAPQPTPAPAPDDVDRIDAGDRSVLEIALEVRPASFRTSPSSPTSWPSGTWTQPTPTRTSRS